MADYTKMRCGRVIARGVDGSPVRVIARCPKCGRKGLHYTVEAPGRVLHCYHHLVEDHGAVRDHCTVVVPTMPKE